MYSETGMPSETAQTGMPTFNLWRCTPPSLASLPSSLPPSLSIPAGAHVRLIRFWQQARHCHYSLPIIIEDIPPSLTVTVVFIILNHSWTKVIQWILIFCRRMTSRFIIIFIVIFDSCLCICCIFFCCLLMSLCLFNLFLYYNWPQEKIFSMFSRAHLK